MTSNTDAARRYREKNREKVREHALRSYYKHHDKRTQYAQEYRMTNAANVMLTRTRHRATKLGLEFNLDITDIVIPASCPVLGIPICVASSLTHNSPSIDKINPNKGYVRGNVRVISARANTLKNNSTYEEMKLICADLERYSSLSNPPI